ncbi:MAG: alanine--tRNA ligase [Microgenomates group bacterium]
MIGTGEVRDKYLNFFKNNGHIVIAPSPLVLENDPTTLFTSSGMQQMIPYLKGETHPDGERLVDSQPSIRMQDLEEVGDNRHTTFFEMLGNWSLGDYFKKEQLNWIWKFFTKEIGFDPKRLYVSVFEGNKEVPKDTESFEIWKEMGVPENHIFFYGAKKNWWSRSGEPDNMPAGEIGGPDSEVFYEFDSIEHDPKFGQECHPNCDCGKFLEIGNSVFMQYKKEEDGTLSELPQKNVDFGGGLERIVAAINGTSDVFKIDIFSEIIGTIEKEVGINYLADHKKDKSFRIIADHIRASANLLAEGVVPSNKLQGYALRRLVRRAMFHLHLLGAGVSGLALSHIAENLKKHYPQIKTNWEFVEENLIEEGKKFGDALKRGLKKLTEIVSKNETVDGKVAFDLYQTDGFPLELTLEILNQNGITFGETEEKSFKGEFEKHKELSRTTSAGIFKGGLESKSDEQVTKLHTATHLLHTALRKVLGEHVSQKGSHITSERLRFDFSHNQKLTDEEVKGVEELINRKIGESLPVSFKETTLKGAIDDGALHFFGERYGEKVKVYSIGEFSKEVCGGPHVENTDQVGHVKIIKQEKIGSGIIRVYAALE